MKTEIDKAQRQWTVLSNFDQKHDSHLPRHLLKIEIPSPPKEGWLKTCREALQKSPYEVAERMEISRQAYARLELNEVDSVITLDRLKKAAEALDCELVYFLRPKNRMAFSAIIWEKIKPQALLNYKKRFKSQPIKSFVLARTALGLLKDPPFRREMKWQKN